MPDMTDAYQWQGRQVSGARSGSSSRRVVDRCACGSVERLRSKEDLPITDQASEVGGRSNGALSEYSG
jgi:hypothetical protein